MSHQKPTFSKAPSDDTKTSPLTGQETARETAESGIDVLPEKEHEPKKTGKHDRFSRGENVLPPDGLEEKTTHFLLDQELRRCLLNGKASKANRIANLIKANGWETTTQTEERLEKERVEKLKTASPLPGEDDPNALP
jgi:hypothetical protein